MSKLCTPKAQFTQIAKNGFSHFPEVVSLMLSFICTDFEISLTFYPSTKEVNGPKCVTLLVCLLLFIINRANCQHCSVGLLSSKEVVPVKMVHSDLL